MSAAGDSLKCLRSLAATRNLRVEVTHSPLMVRVSSRNGIWETSHDGPDTETVFRAAHTAVLERWPRRGGHGGANHTRATIAAKRARVAAEQQEARGV